MPVIVDWLIHGVEVTTFLGVAWRVIVKLNRDESLRSDFPPHRHINGKIIYPREYEPAAVERLEPL